MLLLFDSTKLNDISYAIFYQNPFKFILFTAILKRRIIYSVKKSKKKKKRKFLRGSRLPKRNMICPQLIHVETAEVTAHYKR